MAGLLGKILIDRSIAPRDVYMFQERGRDMLTFDLVALIRENGSVEVIKDRTGSLKLNYNSLFEALMDIAYHERRHAEGVHHE